MNHEFLLEVVREAMRLHIDMEANLALAGIKEKFLFLKRSNGQRGRRFMEQLDFPRTWRRASD
jgi:hypothetical protein